MSAVARCPAVRRVGRVLGVHSLTVAARPEQVREVRRYVAATLGPGHPCLDAATEVVSELATNGILYGSCGAAATITVRVRLLRRRRVRITVIDKGGTGHVPTLRRPEGDELGGRGLLIVNALACRWDWTRHRTGHKVRALLDPLRPGVGALDAVVRPLDLDACLAFDEPLDREES
jgi:anti-sigma regulatory factor (Ser/Thr protein kinase)